MIKKILKIVLLLAVLFGLYVGFWLVYGTLNDWQPEDIIEVVPNSLPKRIADGHDSVFTFVTWNIGFAGLGAETSFFFDGGETVTADEPIVRKNFRGILDFLDTQQKTDFILLQEVDTSAKRSHDIQMVNAMDSVLSEHGTLFTSNFNVDYVPVPFTSPFGHCYSGLVTSSAFSNYFPERRAFSTEYDWPRRIFYLDRCFLKTQVPLQNGNDLIVINLHLSAYDRTGEMVSQQISELLDYAKDEYRKGNYVVIGGDWNQCPPTYEPKDLSLNYVEIMLTNEDIPEGWQWVADPTTPSNRKNEKPYKRGETYTTVIDHFLISPNLSVEDIHGIDLDFQYSDHQPVFMQVRLN